MVRVNLSPNEKWGRWMVVSPLTGRMRPIEQVFTRVYGLYDVPPGTILARVGDDVEYFIVRRDGELERLSDKMVKMYRRAWRKTR